MKDLLDQYATYDLWANMRFVERMQSEPDDVLDRPVPSSFPSLRTTLLHMRDAENAWYCRLTGASVTWPAERSRAIDGLVKYSKRLHDEVLSMDEIALMNEVRYTDLKGESHIQPTWQLLMHCFNHSTQHRGQLITIMRILDLGDIPSNDMVKYQRSLMR